MAWDREAIPIVIVKPERGTGRGQVEADWTGDTVKSKLVEHLSVENLQIIEDIYVTPSTQKRAPSHKRPFKMPSIRRLFNSRLPRIHNPDSGT